MLVVFRFLKKFFLNYLWLGIVLLLVSIIIEYVFTEFNDQHFFIGGFNEPYRFPFDLVLSRLLESLGISLVIATIFSFSASTTQFLDTISNELSKIVISSSFLNQLSYDQKKQTLGAILKPVSDSDNIFYSDIDRYYDFFINNSLSVSKKNIIVDSRFDHLLSLDSAMNVVRSDGTFSYKIFPVQIVKGQYSYGSIDLGLGGLIHDKFNQIKYKELIISTPCGYSKRYTLDTNNSSCNSQLITFDSSGQLIINLDLFIDQEHHNLVSPEGVFEYPPYLFIECEFLHYGADHWLLLETRNIKPTNGFQFSVTCLYPLTIKDYSMFTFGRVPRVRLFTNNGREFFLNNSDEPLPVNLNLDDEIVKIEIKDDNWMTEGTGVSVLAAGPHSDFSSSVQSSDSELGSEPSEYVKADSARVRTS